MALWIWRYCGDKPKKVSMSLEHRMCDRFSRHKPHNVEIESPSATCFNVHIFRKIGTVRLFLCDCLTVANNLLLNLVADIDILAQHLYPRFLLVKLPSSRFQAIDS